ncbi:zeta toxin family protein [Luteimonas huabeiensis]|uniref:zeta toxin family protein n=1 Tax=Luteimonas huabeiensis TaxID=1244513 RepID=UPI0004676A04|nr:zeta toxin family protein [Luteimonas huabeiensis]
MSAEGSRLDPSTHDAIFREKILTQTQFIEASEQARPKAIILGGQPGAGKGGLADTAKLELADDVVKIDPDALRDYHPRASEFRRTHPYAVAGRKNFIFDTTLSNGEWSSELIRDLQAKGYEVEVRVMASPKLESELGVDQRFSDKLEADGHGRYVPASVRDHVYDKLPASLDTIHARTDVPIPRPSNALAPRSRRSS